jgi:hypothetical protein
MAECTGKSQLLIDLAAVRDPRQVDSSGLVINDIDYPVVADTNPPFLFAALELSAASRSGTDARSSSRA